jgi:glycosyltransferase involved in cell wall biosynthesis
MRICYISNYTPDRQESMNRFVVWLSDAVMGKGEQAEVLHPKAITINLIGKRPPLAKWLGYIDKFILFPVYLGIYSRLPRNKHVIYHIVDHSNAFYASVLPWKRVLLTCHDVLAIRGGLGDPDAWCNASRTGKFFQRWILKHLQKCPHIVFVSNATRDDYLKLPDRKKDQHSQQQRDVIYNGLNNAFAKLAVTEISHRLEGTGIDPDQHFFFHIGSSLPRKNRCGIMKAFSQFSSNHSGYQLVFAGESFSEQEQQVFQELEFEPAQVISIGGVSLEVLNALYSATTALVFPSFSEGFGWPVIEAQACGCPVICSNATSLPEVVGEAGILCDAGSPQSIYDAMQKSILLETHAQLIAEGYKNLKRYEPQNTSKRYLALYRHKLEEIR